LNPSFSSASVMSPLGASDPERVIRVVRALALVSVFVQVALVLGIHLPNYFQHITLPIALSYGFLALIWSLLLRRVVRQLRQAIYESTHQHAHPPDAHPYLQGNFAPNHTYFPLSPCQYTGTVPCELVGGQYVRNGGNPLFGDRLAGDQLAQYHWFDGDGALSGLFFAQNDDGTVTPHFVHQPVLTDLYLHARSAEPRLHAPVLPSIALLVDPLASPLRVLGAIMRTIALVVASHLRRASIRAISVANTALVWHDGRVLATCESGPMMRVRLPALESVGWFDGVRAEGEPLLADTGRKAFGEADKLLGWMKKWTTAHVRAHLLLLPNVILILGLQPHVDETTDEMVLYHSTILPPYLLYTVLPSPTSPLTSRTIVGTPVPGVSGASLAHDFGATRTRTILMDLPLRLSPFSTLRGSQALKYDDTMHARFGVLPRYAPERVRWLADEEGGACCIFHTASAWDENGVDDSPVHLLACRLNSAALVYTAGNLAPPQGAMDNSAGGSRCELFHWCLDPTSSTVSQRFALSAIPFEFPCLAPGDRIRGGQDDGAPEWIWGCTLRRGRAFDGGLGRTARVDALAKVGARALVARGSAMGLDGHDTGSCVDKRTVEEILVQQGESNDKADVCIFAMPPGWCAQEPAFVPRRDRQRPDDGWLLFYAFDEAQLAPDGSAPRGAVSELWVLDARGMREVVCRVKLPTRVPYGLHGEWFGEGKVQAQRPVQEVRTLNGAYEDAGVSAAVGRWIESMIG
jgi:carotenoid cleavage dioxygenase-like enzyme